MGHESLDVRMGQQQFVKFLATLQKSDPKGWHDGRLAVFEVPKVPLSAQALEDSRLLKKLLQEAAERDRKAADAARRGQADDFMTGGPIGMSKSAAMEWGARRGGRAEGRQDARRHRPEGRAHPPDGARARGRGARARARADVRVQKWVDKDRSASVTTAGSKSRPSTASGGSRGTRSKKGGKARPGTAGSGGRSAKALFGPPAEGGFRPNVSEQQSLRRTRLHPAGGRALQRAADGRVDVARRPAVAGVAREDGAPRVPHHDQGRALGPRGVPQGRRRAQRRQQRRGREPARQHGRRRGPDASHRRARRGGARRRHDAAAQVLGGPAARVHGQGSLREPPRATPSSRASCASMASPTRTRRTAWPSSPGWRRR